MDISINRNLNVNKPQFEQTASVAPQQKGTRTEKPVLSITQAPMSINDSMDIDVPESELTRDDKLGSLISSAFNLPAPPMPKFE